MELELGNLYEINKKNMSQFKPYDPILLGNKCSEIAKDIWSRERNKPTYWMLLCRERNDYTIFHIQYDSIDLFSAIKECLTNRGKVIDITKLEDGNYEIWIRDFDTEENVIYYLFDYNNAIIEV